MNSAAMKQYEVACDEYRAADGNLTQALRVRATKRELATLRLALEVAAIKMESARLELSK